MRGHHRFKTVGVAPAVLVLGLLLSGVGAGVVLARSSAVPSALRASSLMKAAKLAAALHTRLSAIEDDGGVAAGTASFTSQAAAETHLTILRLTLQSFRARSEAKQGYSLAAGPGHHSLSHLGDAASTAGDNSGQVTVLKGDQVLTVRPDLTAAGDNFVAASGKSPQSLQTTLYGPGLTAARALARHLAGQRSGGQPYYLPAGAVYPCVGTPAALSHSIHRPVTVQPGLSVSPPAQQCDYTIGGNPFLTATYTATQARTAISTGSPQSVFAADLKTAGRRKVKQATVGPVRAFMFLDADWQVDILFNGAAHAVRDVSAPRASAAGARAQTMLVQTLNGYTFTVDYDDCINTMDYELGKVLGSSLKSLGSAAQGTREKLLADMRAWCHDLTAAP